jgi:transposase
MPWDTPRRVRFKTLIENGYSQNHAAEILQVPRSTAQYWLKRPDRVQKPPGAQPKISDQKIQEIINWFTGHYDRRTSRLKAIREHFNLDCCDNTLLAAFARNGYHYHVPDCKPFLSKANKLKRFAFSIENWDRTVNYWRKGFYTDETIVRTDLLRRQRLLRKRGERRRLDCIQFTFHSGYKSIMAWAVIGYNYKSPLYFISYEGEGRGFNQQKYTDQILLGPLKELFEQPGDFFCVEDNSKVHGKTDTKRNRGLCNAVRVECHIYSINWPPGSPDLNPIENIWRVLKQRLRNRKPHGGWTLCDLKEAMVNIWNNEISVELINRHIDTMPDRIRMVRLRKGGPSGW